MGGLRRLRFHVLDFDSCSQTELRGVGSVLPKMIHLYTTSTQRRWTSPLTWRMALYS
jgi:hypothetical protein